MLRRWRDGDGVVSDLIPGRSSGGRGRGHLPDEVEALIREVLRTRYLTRQKRSLLAVHRELARICRSRGWRVPSRGVLARRVAQLDPVRQATARQGPDQRKWRCVKWLMFAVGLAWWNGLSRGLGRWLGMAGFRSIHVDRLFGCGHPAFGDSEGSASLASLRS